MSTSVLSEFVPYVVTDVNVNIDVNYNPFRGLFNAININGKETTIYTPANHPHMSPYHEGVVPAEPFKQKFNPFRIQKLFFWDHSACPWTDEGESSTFANMQRINQIAQGYSAEAQRLLETGFLSSVNPNTIQEGNNIPWDKESQHSGQNPNLRGISHNRIRSAMNQVKRQSGHIDPNAKWYVFMPYSLQGYMENDPVFFYSTSGIIRTPKSIKVQQAQYNYEIIYLNDSSFLNNKSLWEDGGKVVRCIIVPSTAVVQGIWEPFGGAMYNMKLCNEYGAAFGYDGFYMVSKFVTSFTLVRPDLAMWVGARLTA